MRHEGVGIGAFRAVISEVRRSSDSGVRSPWEISGERTELPLNADGPDLTCWQMHWWMYFGSKMPSLFCSFRRTLNILLLALPTTGFAECAPADVSYLFNLAKDDTQPHAVFLGQISQMQLVSETSARTKEGWQATHYDYLAVFSGLRGDRHGFTERTSGKVQIKAIEVEDLKTPFSLPPVGEEALLLFELTNAGWLMRAGGCGGLWVKIDNPKTISDARLCLANDGDC